MSIKSILSHKFFPLLPVGLGILIVGLVTPQIIAPLYTQPTTITKPAPKPVVTSPKAPAPVVSKPVVPPPVKPAVPVAPVAPPAAPIPPKITPVVIPAPDSSVTGFSPTPQSDTPPAGGTGTQDATSRYTSTNWSGYFASGATFSTVAGSWTVPRATGNGTTTSADATWIGIGGVSAEDLIQVGTLNSVSSSGQVSSEAFYELLPAASQPILTMTVTAGDSMTASIDLLSPGQWRITITDITNGLSYTNTVSYTSTQSSAEWIEEDPSYSPGTLVPFDNFGIATFRAGTTTVNGVLLNLLESNAQAIAMVDNNGQPIATPSVLSGDGGGFSVRYSGAN